MTHVKSSQLARIESIDALRGIAAFIVVIYHARQSLWIGVGNLYREYGLDAPPSVWIGYATYPLGYGWLGVTIFFVLSGYCIHRRGAKDLANSNLASLNFAEFFKRRMVRIYPTYVAALVLGGLVDWFLIFSGETTEVGEVSLTPTSFLGSLASLQGYATPFFGSNAVFWTLAMEIHLYLAYPLLYAISRSVGAYRALAFAGIVSCSFIILDACFHIQRMFPYAFLRGPIFLPYWFTWAVGFFIAEVEAGRAKAPNVRIGICALLVSLGCALGLVYARHEEHSEVFWAIIMGAVVWWSLKSTSDWIWSTVVGKFFTRIGVFSFSLYAIHFPIICLFERFYLNGIEKPVSFIPLFLGTACAFIGSYVFFLMVESWSIRRLSLKSKPTRKNDVTVSMEAKS